MQWLRLVTPAPPQLVWPAQLLPPAQRIGLLLLVPSRLPSISAAQESATASSSVSDGVCAAADLRDVTAPVTRCLA
eukprot:3114-Heterococcus_DN1.PRE.2